MEGHLSAGLPKQVVTLLDTVHMARGCAVDRSGAGADADVESVDVSDRLQHQCHRLDHEGLTLLSKN